VRQAFSLVSPSTSLALTLLPALLLSVCRWANYSGPSVAVRISTGAPPRMLPRGRQKWSDLFTMPRSGSLSRLRSSTTSIWGSPRSAAGGRAQYHSQVRTSSPTERQAGSPAERTRGASSLLPAGAAPRLSRKVVGRVVLPSPRPVVEGGDQPPTRRCWRATRAARRRTGQ